MAAPGSCGSPSAPGRRSQNRVCTWGVCTGGDARAWFRAAQTMTERLDQLLDLWAGGGAAVTYLQRVVALAANPPPPSVGPALDRLRRAREAFVAARGMKSSDAADQLSAAVNAANCAAEELTIALQGRGVNIPAPQPLVAEAGPSRFAWFTLGAVAALGAFGAYTIATR